MQKVVRARNTVVLDEKIRRNMQDGTVIKPDVICLDETSPVFSWQGQCVVKPLSTSLQGRQHCAEVKQSVLYQRAFNARSSTKNCSSSEYATSEQLKSYIGSTQFIHFFDFFAD